MRLLRAEFMKLAYQRRTWGLFAAAVFLAVLATALTPWALSRMQNVVVLPLSLPAAVDSVYSKALGAYGGYVCASQPVIDLIKTRARTLVYTTGLAPPSAAA